MLKVNCKQAIVDFKGVELKLGEDILTVGQVISTVLGGQVSNPNLGWILGKKFATEDSVDLKAEEVVFVKKEISDSKHWMGLVQGQVLELLDGGTPKAIVA